MRRLAVGVLLALLLPLSACTVNTVDRGYRGAPYAGHYPPPSDGRWRWDDDLRVYVSVGTPYLYYSHDRSYFRWYDNRWGRASHYRGPWRTVEYRYVPAPLIKRHPAPRPRYDERRRDDRRYRPDDGRRDRHDDRYDRRSDWHAPEPRPLPRFEALQPQRIQPLPDWRQAPPASPPRVQRVSPQPQHQRQQYQQYQQYQQLPPRQHAQEQRRAIQRSAEGARPLEAPRQVQRVAPQVQPRVQPQFERGGEGRDSPRQESRPSARQERREAHDERSAEQRHGRRGEGRGERD